MLLFSLASWHFSIFTELFEWFFAVLEFLSWFFAIFEILESLAFFLARSLLFRRAVGIGYTDGHLAAMPVGAIHILDDEAGVLLRDFEVREVGQQVDATHLYAVMHVGIHQADELLREDTVALAEVDEEAGVARFGLRVLAFVDTTEGSVTSSLTGVLLGTTLTLWTLLWDVEVL